MPAITREGGCLCGKVRYSLSGEPIAVAVCHCRNCQKQSGSALSIIAVIPRKALSLSGELTVYKDQAESGRPVYRQFCGSCGSPVLTDTAAAKAADIIFVKAGTLDDPADLKPATHYWAKSAQSWVTIPAEVEVLERQ